MNIQQHVPIILLKIRNQFLINYGCDVAPKAANTAQFLFAVSRNLKRRNIVKIFFSAHIILFSSSIWSSAMQNNSEPQNQFRQVAFSVPESPPPAYEICAPFEQDPLSVL